MYGSRTAVHSEQVPSAQASLGFIAHGGPFVSQHPAERAKGSACDKRKRVLQRAGAEGVARVQPREDLQRVLSRLWRRAEQAEQHDAVALRHGVGDAEVRRRQAEQHSLAWLRWRGGVVLALEQVRHPPHGGRVGAEGQIVVRDERGQRRRPRAAGAHEDAGQLLVRRSAAISVPVPQQQRSPSRLHSTRPAAASP